MLPALIAAAAAGPSYGQAPGRPPDSHDLRRPSGGDVVVEVEQAPRTAEHYVPPCPGSCYRPLRPGERLGRAFFAPRYIVADPARFGLPAAARGQQWIRYWDDLLLVDRATRRIVRAVPNGHR
jgi:Ni/Co efflux regulator RcnB